MKKILAIILAAAMFTGCANTGANYRTIVDSKPGDTLEQQQKDLAECQAHANKGLSGITC